ncbi:putative protein kinase [Septoria linicola]|nr:putative protein kinase [Septoria linicola]
MPELPMAVAPATCDELFTKYGIVAVFLPSGLPAIEAFSELVDEIILAPHQHRAILDNHRLLLYSESRRTLDEILDIGHVPFMSVQDNRLLESDDHGSTTDTTCASVDAAGPFWHGFLAISLRYLPAEIKRGWLLGYQPVTPDGLAPIKPPDVPLCTYARGKSTNIHRGHLAVRHVSGTATLEFEVMQHRPPAQCDLVKVDRGVGYPLASHRHQIDLGKLQYWIAYVQVSDAVKATMHREVQQYIESIPGVAYFSTASATPTTKELQVDDWMIKDVAGRGARSMKRNESGFKRFQKQLESERATTRALEKSQFGAFHVQRLAASIERSDTLYAFYTPLCLHDFATILREESYSDHKRQVLFVQLIMAISALHAASRVHGDIKLSNICLRKRVPLSLVLIDTVDIKLCTTEGILLTPGHGRTLGYLALEQECTNYSTLVDIWAAGCVGVELLLYQVGFMANRLAIKNSERITYSVWRPISSYTPRHQKPPEQADIDTAKRAFYAFRDALGTSPPASKENLLWQMLDPDPNTRITAGAAAKHPYMCQVWTQASKPSELSLATGSKRKRPQR